MVMELLFTFTDEQLSRARDVLAKNDITDTEKQDERIRQAQSRQAKFLFLLTALCCIRSIQTKKSKVQRLMLTACRLNLVRLLPIMAVRPDEER